MMCRAQIVATKECEGPSGLCLLTTINMANLSLIIQFLPGPHFAVFAFKVHAYK